MWKFLTYAGPAGAMLVMIPTSGVVLCVVARFSFELAYSSLDMNLQLCVLFQFKTYKYVVTGDRCYTVELRC